MQEMLKRRYLDRRGAWAVWSRTVGFHPAPRQTLVSLVAGLDRLGDEDAGLVAHGRRRFTAPIAPTLARFAVGIPFHAGSRHRVQRVVRRGDGSLSSCIVADQTLARRHGHTRCAFPVHPLRHRKRVNLSVLRFTKGFRVLWPMFKLAVRKGGLAVGRVAGVVSELEKVVVAAGCHEEASEVARICALVATDRCHVPLARAR